MNERLYSFFGIVGPIVSFVSIAVSILLSPWFSWQKNALSDLGHATGSSVSPIFNLGLLLGGFLMMIYVSTIFRKYAKYTSISISISAFSLQLVAVFDEIYGSLHFAVSVLFFLSIGLSAIVYTIEKKVYFGILAFFISLISWVTYGRLYDSGIAVPETVSSLAVVSLIVYSAVRIYLGKDKSDVARADWQSQGAISKLEYIRCTRMRRKKAEKKSEFIPSIDRYLTVDQLPCSARKSQKEEVRFL